MALADNAGYLRVNVIISVYYRSIIPCETHLYGFDNTITFRRLTQRQHVDLLPATQMEHFRGRQGNASDRQHNSARYLRRRTVCNVILLSLTTIEGRKLSSLVTVQCRCQNNRGTDVDLFCIDARVVPSWGRFWYRKPDSIVTMVPALVCRTRF
eukprot:1395546-Amorphochlora_amoeboformis.AAC.2